MSNTQLRNGVRQNADGVDVVGNKTVGDVTLCEKRSRRRTENGTFGHTRVAGRNEARGQCSVTKTFVGRNAPAPQEQKAGALTLVSLLLKYTWVAGVGDRVAEALVPLDKDIDFGEASSGLGKTLELDRFLPQLLVVPTSGDHGSTADRSRDGQESDEQGQKSGQHI
jgi:hypothetical protein